MWPRTSRSRIRNPSPSPQSAARDPQSAVAQSTIRNPQSAIRTSAPEVGRRQATAAARVPAVLSARIRRLLRAVRRQRRGLLRSASARAPGRTTRRADRQQSRSRRVLPDGARRSGGRGRRRSSGWRAGTPPGASAHYYAGARRVQRGARCDAYRARDCLHAGARGDADLSESHRLQRSVSPERRRPLQRAGGPLRAATHFRSRSRLRDLARPRAARRLDWRSPHSTAS